MTGNPMQYERHSEQQTADQLIALNSEFQSGSVMPGEFHTQFTRHGFIRKQSVLIDWLPDSANTYFGHFIDQGRRVIEFDVDLDFPSSSSWIDVTDTFLDTTGKSRAQQSKINIALRLFDEAQRCT